MEGALVEQLLLQWGVCNRKRLGLLINTLMFLRFGRLIK